MPEQGIRNACTRQYLRMTCSSDLCVLCPIACVLLCLCSKGSACAEANGGSPPLATMATIESVQRHMACIQQFLESQEQLSMTNALFEEIEASQAATLVRMIGRMKRLPADEAQKLTSTLCAGKWSAVAKDRLAKAIADRVKQSMGGNGTQECYHFANYLSNEDYEALQDPRLSRMSKVHVVVDRMIAIDLLNPSEQCRLGAAGLIAQYVPDVRGKELPDDIRFWLKERSKQLQQSRDKEAMITDYPRLPKDLPAALYKTAYKGVQPAPEGFVDSSDHRRAMARLHLRNSRAQSKEVCSAPATSTSCAAAPDLKHLMFQYMMNQQMQTMRGQLGFSAPTNTSQLIAPQPRVEETNREDKDERAPMLGLDVGGDDDAPDDDDIAKAEAEMIAAIQTKTKKMKRPAAAAGAAAKSSKGEKAGAAAKSSKGEKITKGTKVITKTKKKTRGVNLEASVKQVLARTGHSRGSKYPGSKAFPFKTDKEIPSKRKLAEAWLKTIPLP